MRTEDFLHSGYKTCVVYLKLFEKLDTPLTRGILAPFRPDIRLNQRISELDKLYPPPFPMLSTNWLMLSD